MTPCSDLPLGRAGLYQQDHPHVAPQHPGPKRFFVVQRTNQKRCVSGLDVCSRQDSLKNTTFSGFMVHVFFHLLENEYIFIKRKKKYEETIKLNVIYFYKRAQSIFCLDRLISVINMAFVCL